MTDPEIKVGQLWEMNDKRWTVPRMLRVTFVGYYRVSCRAWYASEVRRTFHGEMRASHIPVPAHGVERKIRVPILDFRDGAYLRLVADHSAVGGKPEGRQ